MKGDAEGPEPTDENAVPTELLTTAPWPAVAPPDTASAQEQVGDVVVASSANPIIGEHSEQRAKLEADDCVASVKPEMSTGGGPGGSSSRPHDARLATGPAVEVTTGKSAGASVPAALLTVKERVKALMLVGSWQLDPPRLDYLRRADALEKAAIVCKILSLDEPASRAFMEKLKVLNA